MTVYFWGALFLKIPRGVPCNTRNILVKKTERWHSERDAFVVRLPNRIFAQARSLYSLGHFNAASGRECVTTKTEASLK